MNNNLPEPPATVGQASAEAHDPKMQRTKQHQGHQWCRHCDGLLKSAGHSAGCPLATAEDLLKEVERARRCEKWARERAAFWLHSVRLMHGKLAGLKAEVKKLRKRCAPN